MWTQENRARYDRSRLRYPSDLTDKEWAVIGPLIPPAERGGTKRTVDVRAVVDGVMYILSTGCQWAALPKDPPPRGMVDDCPWRWDEDRRLDRIHHALHVLCREQADREARTAPPRMSQFWGDGLRKLLVATATDLSPRSDRAVRRAAGLAWSSGAELLPFHVLEDGLPPGTMKAERREAARLLWRQSTGLPELRCVGPRIMAEAGDASVGGTRPAEAQAADLVVPGGTRRRHPLSDVLIGTTAGRVMWQGRRPVLMVSRLPDGPYRRVLAAPDFAEGSARALRAGAALGRLKGAEFRVLHALGVSIQGDRGLMLAAVVKRTAEQANAVGLPARAAERYALALRSPPLRPGGRAAVWRRSFFRSRRNSAGRVRSAGVDRPTFVEQAMGITDLFSADGVFLDLAMGNKAGLLHALSAEAAHRLRRPEQEVLGALQARERLGSTALGRGVALPHARLRGNDAPLALFARLRRPIDFEARDEEPVDLVFLVLWPEASPEGFLPALSELLRALRNPQVLRRLRLAKSPEEVVTLLRQSGPSPAGMDAVPGTG